MAKQHTTEIDSLAAPSLDVGVVVRPEAAQLLALAEANRRARLDCRIGILGRSLCEWTRLRKDDPIVFMAGHQPEFFQQRAQPVAEILGTRFRETADAAGHDRLARLGFVALQTPQAAHLYAAQDVLARDVERRDDELLCVLV